MPLENPNCPARDRSGGSDMRALRLDRVDRLSNRFRLGATFRYAKADPLVVLMELQPPDGGRITWAGSRDLLFDGMEDASGMGDIRVWPSVAMGRRVVCMRLEAYGQSCLLEIDRDRLAKWLLETFDLVHPGTEFCQVDWQDSTAALFEGKRSQP
ncbi:SsgA family sporulation/cell division regulator [Streptomyces fructofermentans]|uniref:SsgA family sporulation/cell division regulator n=1 Tax=Streptomyces fructofermentans TaxID=152141 RepID=UPI003791AC68